MTGTSTIDESEIDPSDDMFTDTSMFDAEEIVRSIEAVARKRRDDGDTVTARQRFEMYLEEKQLREQLADFNDYVADRDDFDS